MERYIEKICPKCGKVMTRHWCNWDPPCDVKYICSEHRGGCGYTVKRVTRTKRRNWNPYKEKNSNKKDSTRQL